MEAHNINIILLLCTVVLELFFGLSGCQELEKPSVVMRVPSGGLGDIDFHNRTLLILSNSHLRYSL